MPDWLTKAVQHGPPSSLYELVERLLVALAVGWMTALVYRLTQRHRDDFLPGFATTLVMLTVILALITQVIGDNVARAFSLVGSLAVVRFRTPVDDTRDTAYVILAVAVGMACGAGMIEIALIAVPVVGLAASLLPAVSLGWLRANGWYRLAVRIDRSSDVDAICSTIFGKYLQAVRCDASKSGGERGDTLEWTYTVRLRHGVTETTFVHDLLEVPGVKEVELKRK